MGERGGANLYGFVGNNPVSGLDGLGLAPEGFDPIGDGVYEDGNGNIYSDPAPRPPRPPRRPESGEEEFGVQGYWPDWQTKAICKLPGARFTGRFAGCLQGHTTCVEACHGDFGLGAVGDNDDPEKLKRCLDFCLAKCKQCLGEFQ